MPELPEVETIRRQLEKVLVGKKIKKLEILNPKNIRIQASEIIGSQISQLRRQAKVLIIFLNNHQAIIFHFKMTGQLIYEEKNRRIRGGHPTSDWYKKLPVKATKLIIEFDNGGKLYFNDQRGFGWVENIPQDKIKERLENFSPIDPLSPQFTWKYLAKICSSTRRPIKLTIMNQKQLGGVGNIYANDALWLAKIHPLQPSNSLTKEEIKRLHQALIEVINEGLKYNGASINTYIDIEGEKGSYQQHFKVYSRAGQKCLRNDGGVIEVIRVGGRRTFYCPVCQKLRK